MHIKNTIKKTVMRVSIVRADEVKLLFRGYEKKVHNGQIYIKYVIGKIKIKIYTEINL